jgi:hypothetical protein
MIDADGAQRAREWLERQLAELGQLRNASRRDQGFKSWRQQTLTVIQRIWPGDVRRGERFRRIPFTPPSSLAGERQAREYYERGWGEAGVLLRELLAEINLLGLPQVQAIAYGDSDAAAPNEHAPMLDLPATPSAAAPPPPDVSDGTDDIGRAMERLLGRVPPPGPPRPPTLAVAPRRAVAPSDTAGPAEELRRLAAALAELDVPPARVNEVRVGLLALARALATGPAPWERVSEALMLAGTSPALARRVLPLLLELVARAA